MGGTAREQIRSAISRITHGPDDAFAIAQVLAELRSNGTELAESTIRRHISSRVCADAPNNHDSTYDDLERVDRGVYRLRSDR